MEEDQNGGHHRQNIFTSTFIASFVYGSGQGLVSPLSGGTEEAIPGMITRR
jgi:hypothetical protein